VAPLTTGGRPAPFRIAVRFEGKTGLILLDQLRTLDRQRLIRRLGIV
jgi:mRNA interferase MazF